MKENRIEKWKSAVMTMPDTSFFELLRTVFGKIKTPFNKQQLLTDLEKFLLRPDIQETIAALIDTQDAKVISAVALFGEPTPEELERFFIDEFNSIQLHDIITNLEERFILYHNDIYLALNPVLEKVLEPFAANTAILFPQSKAAEKIKSAEKKEAALNDRILAGLLSFVSELEGTAFYKKERQLRKQILNAGRNCFPGLDLEQILGALQVLGLFYKDGENLYCENKRFSGIAALSARERMEYCAASLIVYNNIVLKETDNPEDIQAGYYKNRIKEAVSFIHALMDSLYSLYKDSENENCFSETTLNRLIEIHRSKTGYIVDTNILLEALNKCSLLTSNFSLLTPHSSLLTPHCSLFHRFKLIGFCLS